MPAAILEDRAIISVRGAEAEHFLQNLITTDLDRLDASDVAPGALLTPQGKILFDFLISRDGDGYRLECRSGIADELLRRLMLYRLRAKVELSQPDQRDITVSWVSDSIVSSGLMDRRFPGRSVYRHYGETPPESDASNADWDAFRISNGAGESGSDYALGDAFPHDVLFDQNGGVSFKKGCFVGQEVVSRMQHRGTARRRLLLAKGESNLPEPGTEITTGGRTIGTLGSTAGDAGLALVRIDRVAKALVDGVEIMAGNVPIALTIPDWASFEFPVSDTSADHD